MTYLTSKILKVGYKAFAIMAFLEITLGLLFLEHFMEINVLPTLTNTDSMFWIVLAQLGFISIAITVPIMFLELAFINLKDEAKKKGKSKEKFQYVCLSILFAPILIGGDIYETYSK